MPPSTAIISTNRDQSQSTVNPTHQSTHLIMSTTADTVTARLDAAITEQTRAEYARAGAVCLRGVFDERWLTQLAAGIDKNFAHETDGETDGENVGETDGETADNNVDETNYQRNYTAAGNPGGFYDDYCNWQRIDEYRDFILHSPAAAIAGRLMGAQNVRIYHEHVLIKEPGTAEVTPWHHDLPYYGLDGKQLCSLWLPLDEVPQRVCPEFVAGSHANGVLYYPRMFATHENYERDIDGFETVPDIDANRAQYEILSWSLARGDCIVFDMRAVHGAPHTIDSTARRRGFSCRWLGDDARFATRPWQTSPPFEQLTLAPGAPMDDPLFPIVWRQ